MKRTRLHNLMLSTVLGMGLGIALAGQAMAQDTIVVADAGGAQADAFAKWLYGPFERDTGIKVIADHTTALGKAQAMAKSGNVVWDVFVTGDTDVAQAVQDDILLPVDWQIVPKERIPSDAMNDYGVYSGVYALVMTYNTNLITDPPKTWAEWFDTAKYDCPRTMRNVPIDNLEAAMLASGAGTAGVYPIDLDKAYAQLDKVKDNVVTFWDSGAQSIQIVADGSACLGTAWTSRVTAAQKAGQPVERVWSDAIYHQDFFTVMKGAKNPDAAMKFLAYSLRPEVRAGIASDLGWIMPDPAIQALMDPSSLKFQPTPDQFQQGMIASVSWWSENLMDAYKRYSSWLTL